MGQTTNLGYQNASRESKELAHTNILVYGCLEAFQNGCQKFVMTSSKIYRKFKWEIKFEKSGSKLNHTFIYENVTNVFFLKNGPFRLLRAPIDVEWSQESEYGLRIFFYPLAGFLKFSILGLTGFTSTHRCEGPPKNEKKKKLIRFEKTIHPIRPIFGGCLKGP